MELNHYRLLGRSGLRVSPMALGTMTFGTEWGWGSDEAEARRVFDTYVDRGGNFIDTANRYTEGRAERMIGTFCAGRRDKMVIATKYNLPMDPTNPNSGGNHRRSMVRSVEASLEQLGTDYIDLLYLHHWDDTTSVEEIMRGLDDLVRSGKVVYVGVSDIPAWQAARMQTLADLRGWAPLVALQIEYNLIERTAERDLSPMASELGLGVIPWSPLANGILAGKYSRSDLEAADIEGDVDAGNSRRGIVAGSGLLTERGLSIADTVKDVAKECACSPAQIALAWLLGRQGVTSPLIGARTLSQLEDNLGALDVILSEAHRQRLDDASAIELGFPHDFLNRPTTKQMMFGDLKIDQVRR
jgi:aryl-alcohol dehydrogenase-like predicted oxidoreductase